MDQREVVKLPAVTKCLFFSKFNERHIILKADVLKADDMIWHVPLHSWQCEPVYRAYSVQGGINVKIVVFAYLFRSFKRKNRVKKKVKK